MKNDINKWIRNWKGEWKMFVNDINGNNKRIKNWKWEWEMVTINELKTESVYKRLNV